MKLRTLSMAVISLGFTLAIFLGTAIPSAWAKGVSLNYANFPPAPTFPCVQMERWKTEVEKRTDGAVSVNTFPGGTLLGAKDMMDGVINGQADIGCICMAYQPGRFMVTNATSLPLNIPDAKTGSLVLLDLYNQYQPESFKKVKVLTMFVSAPANIMSKEPVKSLADLKGLDLRASGGAAQILKSWGANQVGMPMSATPEALQKGVVKGLFSSLEVMKDLKFAEICKNVTNTDTVIYPFAVIMNKSKWDGLPDKVKKVMDDLSVEQAAWTGEYMDNHVKESMAWSKEKHQVKVITLTPEQKKEWDDKLAPITAKWIESAKAKNLPGEKIVDDIKSLIKKHM
ncbi:TRAP transporter substrate-binding protein [Desulfospira joergensenii]|uniref:TRAP transporter substrate-binding protein n=1 Tax=Desulfospira joergensenii TaxID=53329 RepID=UPI0003B4AE8F|nr:TRAP transporter substrate-binding protein [Desulfospira joergensenii]